MSIGDMFCLGPGALGVQECARTSEQGASNDQRASAESLAAEAGSAAVDSLTRHGSGKGQP